jgi:hypothetical protein
MAPRMLYHIIGRLCLKSVKNKNTNQCVPNFKMYLKQGKFALEALDIKTRKRVYPPGANETNFDIINSNEKGLAQRGDQNLASFMPVSRHLSKQMVSLL